MNQAQIPGLIAGIDEAGRGPLAGPVTAACVVFPPEYQNPELADSKKLSEKKREQLANEIRQAALAFSVVSVGPRRIEALNIREATRLAMRLCLTRVLRNYEISRSAGLRVLIDGNMPIEFTDTFVEEETIIKGDQKVAVISAASILAKVGRDSLMINLDKKYPGYELAKHKGYPTKAHREKIAGLGPSRAHRQSFAGVREYLAR